MNKIGTSWGSSGLEQGAGGGELMPGSNSCCRRSGTVRDVAPGGGGFHKSGHHDRRCRTLLTMIDLACAGHWIQVSY